MTNPIPLVDQPSPISCTEYIRLSKMICQKDLDYLDEALVHNYERLCLLATVARFIQLILVAERDGGGGDEVRQPQKSKRVQRQCPVSSMHIPKEVKALVQPKKHI